MAEYRGIEIAESRALRCQLCGQQIGLIKGPDPDPDTVILRCHGCAATEEAEAILSATEGRPEAVEDEHPTKGTGSSA